MLLIYATIWQDCPWALTTASIPYWEWTIPGCCTHNNRCTYEFHSMSITFPTPEQLCRTEVYEFALGLSKSDFSLPSFQVSKFLHVFKLIEAGLVAKVSSRPSSQLILIHASSQNLSPFPLHVCMYIMHEDLHVM